jgi:hypothetical protein
MKQKLLLLTASLLPLVDLRFEDHVIHPCKTDYGTKASRRQTPP